MQCGCSTACTCCLHAFHPTMVMVGLVCEGVCVCACDVGAVAKRPNGSSGFLLRGLPQRPATL